MHGQRTAATGSTMVVSPVGILASTKGKD
jgi:hypothetical protein